MSSDELEIWCALHQLECKHWHDVDFNGGRSAHEFYRDDGLFAVGQNRFEGRDVIRTFYDWRRGRGEVTTRHLISNVIVVAQDESRAKAVGSITVYRARGIPPLRRADGPTLIADFVSECVRGDDAVWRYVAHVLDPVFVDSDAPFSLSIDPAFLAARHAAAAATPPTHPDDVEPVTVES
jgi:SnoaL-like domain